jgi:hypothetical protein
VGGHGGTCKGHSRTATATAKQPARQCLADLSALQARLQKDGYWHGRSGYSYGYPMNGYNYDEIRPDLTGAGSPAAGYCGALLRLKKQFVRTDEILSEGVTVRLINFCPSQNIVASCFRQNSTRSIVKGQCLSKPHRRADTVIIIESRRRHVAGSLGNRRAYSFLTTA